MRICIDLDGTICTQEQNYADAKPIWAAIEWLNHSKPTDIIIIHTARHWNHLTLTKEQLDRWGVRYDTLVMGKPPADIYIDDRAIPFPWEHRNGNEENKG